MDKMALIYPKKSATWKNIKGFVKSWSNEDNDAQYYLFNEIRKFLETLDFNAIINGNDHEIVDVLSELIQKVFYIYIIFKDL